MGCAISQNLERFVNECMAILRVLRECVKSLQTTLFAWQSYFLEWSLQFLSSSYCVKWAFLVFVPFFPSKRHDFIITINAELCVCALPAYIPYNEG